MDVCLEGACVYAPSAEPCDDGDACTAADACAAGACAGEAVSCDDGNACTDDACDSASGCGSVANTAGCDDGDACTEGDVCSASSCAGVALDCDDGDVCTDDSCKPGLGCLHQPNAVACDDGDATTRGDVCDGTGTCGGEPFECVAGTCEASSTHNGVDCDVVLSDAGVACDDQDVATAIDVCDGSGGCVGTAITCEPNQCQVSAVPNGVDCDIVDQPQGTVCDDGLTITADDVCNGSGSCGGLEYVCAPTQCDVSSTHDGVGCVVVWKDALVACDDGDPVTDGDVCDGSGGCAGQAAECAPTQCELTSVPSEAGCDVVWKSAEAACDDGDPATAGDLCDGAGGCQGDRSYLHGRVV